MVGGVGKALEAMFVGMAFALILFVPLGLWKLGELIYWLVTHVRVTW